MNDQTKYTQAPFAIGNELGYWRPAIKRGWENGPKETIIFQVFLLQEDQAIALAQFLAEDYAKNMQRSFSGLMESMSKRSEHYDPVDYPKFANTLGE